VRRAQDLCPENLGGLCQPKAFPRQCALDPLLFSDFFYRVGNGDGGNSGALLSGGRENGVHKLRRHERPGCIVDGDVPRAARLGQPGAD